MKKLIFIAVLCSVLLGCASRPERAIRHLNQAIKLDSSILTKQTVDTVIQGMIVVKDSIVYKQKDSQFVLNADSISRAIDRSRDSSVVIYQDSTRTVTVKKLPSGKLMAKIENKSITLPYEKLVPYKVKVRVQGKGFKVPVDRPFWQYKWFWFLLTSNILFLYLFISTNKKASIFIERIRNKVTR